MIWAILALLGVPLWFCAIGIGVLVLRNRRLRKRLGDVPVRVRRAGKKRWIRGHGTWVHDVFAFRGSPAAWREHLLWVDSVTFVPASDADEKRLRHLGPGFVIARFRPPDGEPADFATSTEHAIALAGPKVAVPAPDSALSQGR